MSTHLGETINAVQNVFQTDNDDILDFRYPIRVQIESEQMDVSGAGFVGSEAIRWSVTRGVAGTTKAAHGVGTAITAVNASSGGGGGGVSVDNTVDPPFSAATLVVPGATQDGDSANLKPAVVSDTDPGAIGAGQLWLRTDSGGYPALLLVRNDDNDGWIEAALAHYDADNRQRGYLQFFDDGWDLTYRGVSGIIAFFRHGPGGAIWRWQLDDNSRLAEVFLGTNDGTPTGIGSFTLTNEIGSFGFLRGAADPSVGAGVVWFGPAIYFRDVAGDGVTLEYWLKTGTADTAWTKLTLP